jgi:hypothetical protein
MRRSNGSFGMFNAPFLLVFGFREIHPPYLIFTWMLIGRVVLIIVALLMVCYLSWPNLIPWSSRKQPMALHSTTEAEYKELTNGTAKAIWILVFVEGAWHTSVHSSCFYSVIILEPHMSSILVFMPVPSILKLSFTTFVKRLLWAHFMSVLLHQVIRLLTSLLNQLHT